MNEKEAEEQGTFLKGVLRALEDMASDLDRTKNRAEITLAGLEGVKQRVRGICKDIEAYFHVEND